MGLIERDAGDPAGAESSADLARPDTAPTDPSTLLEDAPRPLPALGPKPGPIELSDPLATAGRKAMWIHVDRLLAREPGMRDPDRPDELRKYRVAIRRLRAAARMFADAYPDREIRPLRRGLGDLAGAVGAVRDLDHRIAHLNQWSLERGEASRASVPPLLRAWGDERRRAFAELHRRIESRRHRRLVIGLVEFVDRPSPADRRLRFAGPSTVGDRLASSVWAAYEEVRAFAPVVRKADLETLHDLRIATKRFRDDLEFLADVLGPDRAWLLERLVALQDHLGALNDAAVGASGVRTFLEDRDARLTVHEQSEITAYLADREREIAVLQQSSVARWRPVAGILFARRLSRLVVVPAGTT